MPKRDELFRKFSPIFLEAFLLMTLDAINELRLKSGLQVYTKDQVMTTLEKNLSTLTPYDWMTP